ncbi:MAG: LuxR C-terminal-related transcriptional regulator [Candidatus Acidiferrum sp.]
MRRTPFASLIFNSTIGVALFDRNLHCKAISAVLARMIGVPTTKLVGKPIDQLFPGEAPFLEPAFRRVWNTGEALANVEITAQCSYGPKECIWLLNFYPVKDDLGQVQLVAATFSDVTQKRCAERKLCNVRDKFGEAMQGDKHPFGEEFVELSARAFELANRSVELLNNSMTVRRHTLEMRIEAGLARAALFLSGTQYHEFLSKCIHSDAEPHFEDYRFSPEPGDANEEPGGGPSPRERQLLYFLADGKSNKEIGSLLEISTRTVETYRARIMLKLDLHSTAALVRYAIRNHIVEA